MTTPCLTDPEVFPSEAVLARHLGERAGLWNAFERLLGAERAALALDWKYYRDGKRWLGKAVRKKKTMCWVSIWRGMFKVTFYLGCRNDAAVARAKIAPRIKRELAAAKGRSTYPAVSVEVRTKAALRDVAELLHLKESLSA